MNRFSTLSARARGNYRIWKNQPGHTVPQSRSTGRQKQLETRPQVAGVALLQAKQPLQAVNLCIDGFHRYSDDARQLRPELVEDRDQWFGLSTAERRRIGGTAPERRPVRLRIHGRTGRRCNWSWPSGLSSCRNAVRISRTVPD